MSFLKKLLFIVCVLAFLGAGYGCEQEGPAERAGEEIDEAMEETGDELEEAADEAEEATDQ
ncbi:MAG: hypothetical protein ACLFP9_05670 [Desulfonatronovibrio sp.]